jgi:hypothetical protein
MSLGELIEQLRVYAEACLVIGAASMAVTCLVRRGSDVRVQSAALAFAFGVLGLLGCLLGLALTLAAG